MTEQPRAWIIVAGSGIEVREDERVAATRLGELLARENYGLIAGTWAGVDEIVTRAFAKPFRDNSVAQRIVHIENSPSHSRHPVRLGRIIASSPSEPYSLESVDLADAGVVVGGRAGSKPTMDALIEGGKPVVPFAWLGSDALASLTDLLRDAAHAASPRSYKRFLLPLVDPVCAVDESISRVLGGVTARKYDIFVSYHRADAGPQAGRIAHDLMDTYGRKRVFLDHSGLAPAALLETLVRTARGTRLVVACIGPNWSARVAEKDDWVRKELSAALEQGAAVVPLVTAGGQLPKGTDVPPPLQSLCGVKAVCADQADWERTLARVVEACDRELCITRMRPAG